ncbi:MAG: Bug family tripartite tricarboxylate transporter substrate binding protein [Pigmentiphaga sp.]
MASILTASRYLIGALCLLGLGANSAVLAAWPERPIRLIVPYAAGGGTDTISRILAERMSLDLGQAVIVENRPGATGTIAANSVASANPDGYTLLMATTSMLTVTPHIRKDLPYDPQRDLVPISLVARQPFFLVSEQQWPLSNVEDLGRMAAVSPEGVTYASFGTGSPPHLGAELLKRLAGFNLVHVPYKGGSPAIMDLLAGRVQVMFVDAPPIVSHVATGKIKVLAVSTQERSELMPEVPAVAETIPGFDFSPWFGIVAPAGVPANVVDKLQRSIADILHDPAVRQRMAELGTEALGSTTAEFADYIVAENAKWKELVEMSNISGE